MDLRKRMTHEPRVAVVHEWLVNYGGSERVVEQLLRVFPNAELFSLVDFLSENERKSFLGGRRAKTTFIQRLPKAQAKFRGYLPLMPLAVEQHDLSGFDIVISSSHAVAKGVLTGPSQLHVSYVHSPIRYAWDLQHQYLAESGMTRGTKSWIARAILHYMRLWDTRTACGVDHFIANSNFIARRIAKVYGREATTLYPPVDTERFKPHGPKQRVYVTASRMVPYKRVPLIVEAFARMPQHKLIVLGDGPDYERAKALATPNITLLGHQPFESLKKHMQAAQAFIFAAEEDFGIAPVEAQACGTPVIALGRGGALETVRGLGISEKPTGVFFKEQTVESIMRAVELFERNRESFSSLACRENAERFSTERFVAEIRTFIDRAWHQHLNPERSNSAFGFAKFPRAVAE